MKVNINTKRLRECGNDILKLVEELRDTYCSLFDRIDKIPTTTKEWVGESSEKFVTLVRKDKINYINYINDLKKYGNYLIESANSLDQLISKVRR